MMHYSSAQRRLQVQVQGRSGEVGAICVQLGLGGKNPTLVGSLYLQSVADPGIKVCEGTWRAREREPITGVLGAEPPAGSRGRAPGGGQWKWQNCLILPILQSQ